MHNFEKSFFEQLLPSANMYYAHLPPTEQDEREAELLSMHSGLVASYAQKIAEFHGLNKVIDDLIKNSIPENFVNKQLLAEIVDKLFWQAIAFHDLGKLNHVFQKNRMNNNAAILKVQHSFQSQHSIISVYLFLAIFFKELLKQELHDSEQIFICNVALYLSYPIYRHHSKFLEQAQNEDIWDNENLFALSPYLSLLNIKFSEEQIEQFHAFFLSNANFNFFFDRFNENFFETGSPFPIYALIKLNYSLLTASDYLATAHYMNGWKEMLLDFGVIDESLKNKIYRNAQNSKSYNKTIFDALKRGEKIEPEKCKEANNTNLNTLRKYLAMEVIENIRNNIGKKLFYIEAPTGGGKTNISILALAELLKEDKSIKKAFYVFPFTTLITQTYKTLKDTLGLQDYELAEIHSKAPFQVRNNENETYDYKNYLDNLFMNYPITLLSHVHFFDVLKTNDKEMNYLLHRFANSVVIIDEIQSYLPKTWDRIIYFVVNYAKYFNMKFIIMSATLPKIGDIINEKNLANDFVYLISDKNVYFQNPNFSRRITFDYSLLKWEKPKKENLPCYLNNLKDFLLTKSSEYSLNNKIHRNSVFTIIEFIFKKTASEFYTLLSSNNVFFDEILLLSGTILEPRRKQVISYLKSEEAREKKILLICTQVVEAGVDIDMDIGFKDKSIIDSEEQLAGRINRNVNKKECALYLFNCNPENKLYGDDDRYRIMREDFNQEEYESILQSKDFDRLYATIIQKIKKRNGSDYIENIKKVYWDIQTLNFSNVNNSLKIVNQQNISVFVPLEIERSLLFDFDHIIKEFQIPCINNIISGKDVWEYYENIVKDQNESFVRNRIKIKKLQGLMSSFIFSVFPNSNDYLTLKTYGEEKCGFLYLENYKDIYSFQDGINTEKLKDSYFI